MSTPLEKIQEPLQRAGEALGNVSRDLGEFVRAMVDFVAAVTAGLPDVLKNLEVQAALLEAPPKVRHLALHGKKYRTRKKNINRALREYRRRHRHEPKMQPLGEPDRRASAGGDPLPDR